MKQFLAFVILICFLFSGCQLVGERIKEPVTFYYIQGDYQDALSDAIASEIREASGHLDDLSYLMALYLMGPTEENHISPLPRGTRIYVVQNSPSGRRISCLGTLSQEKSSSSCRAVFGSAPGLKPAT